MTEQVEVVITDKNAVYVNDTRITHRGTKWGLHRVLERFTCDKSDVYQECISRGYHVAADFINTPPYAGRGGV